MKAHQNDPVISRAVAHIFREKPFLMEIGLEHMVFVPDVNCTSNGKPTMATDGVSTFYHPDVLTTWKLEEIKGCIVHEWLHPALSHLDRYDQLDDKDQPTYNVAADMVVNPMVDSFGFKLPSFAVKRPEEYSDEAVWFTEAIFRDLLKKKRKGPEPQPGKPKPDPDGEPKDGEPKDGEGDGNPDPNGKPKGGSKPKDEPKGRKEGGQQGSDDLRRPPGPKPTKSEVEAKETKDKAILTRLAKGAKEAGCCPVGLEQLVKDWLEPKVDWKARLRHLATRTAKSGWSYTRSHASYRAMGYYVPGRYSKEIGELVIVRDTSGSLYHKQVEVTAEAFGAVADCKPSKVVLIDADAAVHRVLEINPPFSEWPDNALGGGGTDFRPAFDEVERRGYKPAVMIYITDSYGTFPHTAPGYEVIWAIIDGPDDATVPFGETVFVPSV